MRTAKFELARKATADTVKGLAAIGFRDHPISWLQNSLSSGAPARAQMGGGMMPPMGGARGGKGEQRAEKRIAAPGVPNRQTVRGRMVAPPSITVTKSVDVKPKSQAVVTATKRIVEPVVDDES